MEIPLILDIAVMVAVPGYFIAVVFALFMPVTRDKYACAVAGLLALIVAFNEHLRGDHAPAAAWTFVSGLFLYLWYRHGGGDDYRKRRRQLWAKIKRLGRATHRPQPAGVVR
jgi:hypothetical protein